jgi:hypothetical protein
MQIDKLQFWALKKRLAKLAASAAIVFAASPASAVRTTVAGSNCAMAYTDYHAIRNTGNISITGDETTDGVDCPVVRLAPANKMTEFKVHYYDVSSTRDLVCSLGSRIGGDDWQFFSTMQKSFSSGFTSVTLDLAGHPGVDNKRSFFLTCYLYSGLAVESYTWVE